MNRKYISYVPSSIFALLSINEVIWKINHFIATPFATEFLYSVIFAALLAGYFAKKTGRNMYVWLLIGGASIFMIFCVFCLPDKDKRTSRKPKEE